jgi:hypothetical protein
VSYLHCPACQRAYNVAREPACPSCGIRPGGSPTDDVVRAAEQLARAIGRAAPAELAAAEATLETRSARLALPASTADGSLGSPASAASAAPSILRAVRAALFPAPAAPPPTGAHQALLATVVLALLTRVAPQRSLPLRAARSVTTWSNRARALLSRF